MWWWSRLEHHVEVLPDYWIISQFKLCVVSSLTQELSSCESALNVRANKEKNSGFWKCLRGWKTASASNDSSWKLENSSNVFAYGVSYTMFICSSAYIWSCVFCHMITMSYLARLLFMCRAMPNFWWTWITKWRSWSTNQGIVPSVSLLLYT